jgi:hypothetical protein
MALELNRCLGNRLPVQDTDHIMLVTLLTLGSIRLQPLGKRPGAHRGADSESMASGSHGYQKWMVSLAFVVQRDGLHAPQKGTGDVLI